MDMYDLTSQGYAHADVASPLSTSEDLGANQTCRLALYGLAAAGLGGLAWAAKEYVEDNGLFCNLTEDADIYTR